MRPDMQQEEVQLQLAEAKTSTGRGRAHSENQELMIEDEQEGEEATAEVQKEGHEQLQQDSNATEGKETGRGLTGAGMTKPEKRFMVR